MICTYRANATQLNTDELKEFSDQKPFVKHQIVTKQSNLCKKRKIKIQQTKNVEKQTNY